MAKTGAAQASGAVEVRAAMEEVLATERAAMDAIGASQRRAEELMQAARSRARSIADRAQARIAALERGSPARGAALGGAPGGARVALAPSDAERVLLDRALERLADRLLGNDDARP